jgi:hypothetical protein
MTINLDLIPAGSESTQTRLRTTAGRKTTLRPLAANLHHPAGSESTQSRLRTTAGSESTLRRLATELFERSAV